MSATAELLVLGIVGRPYNSVTYRATLWWICGVRKRRSANKFPRLPSRTRKYQTFMTYTLSQYQCAYVSRYRSYYPYIYFLLLHCSIILYIFVCSLWSIVTKDDTGVISSLLLLESVCCRGQSLLNLCLAVFIKHLFVTARQTDQTVGPTDNIRHTDTSHGIITLYRASIASHGKNARFAGPLAQSRRVVTIRQGARLSFVIRRHANVESTALSAVVVIKIHTNFVM